MTFLTRSDAPRQLPIDANTLIQWKLTEAAAPYANTGSAGALNLTVAAGAVVKTRAGLFGQALGIGSQVHAGILTSGNTSLGESATDLTISAWVCPTDTFVTGAYIIGKNSTAGGWAAPWASPTLTLSGIAGLITVGGATTNINGAGFISTSPDKLVLGTWSLVAGTYVAATGVLTTYKDGDALGSVTLAPSGSLAWGTHGQWMVGGLDQAGAAVTTCFPGMIQDVRIENVARSAAYLLNMYRRGMGIVV